MVAWSGLIWLITGASGVSFECGNESSGSIKYGDQLRTGQLLKKDSAPWYYLVNVPGLYDMQSDIQVERFGGTICLHLQNARRIYVARLSTLFGVP